MKRQMMEHYINTTEGKNGTNSMGKMALKAKKMIFKGAQI